MDAGYYGHCGGCEATLCGSCYDNMRKEYGELGEEHERADWFGEEAPNCCDICSGKVIDEGEFVLFLIGKIGKTREDLETEYRNKLAEKG
ncbi:hypothetical protein M1D49_07885 [Bacillus sp. PK3-056]|uniref:hypothetical protein n=1 Tax=Niallia circulans TaxID=1397 RepID=UPI0019D3163F|nr:hypothetical protein [Niallia circulans]